MALSYRAFWEGFMRTKIRVLFGLVIAASMSFTFAQNMGKGKVDFGGEIVIVPCGLDTNSRNQLIDLGTINPAQGVQPRRLVQIKLVDCELSNKNKPAFSRAQIAFYGEPDAQYADQLGLKGDARGIRLFILNSQLQKISLGKTLSDYEIVEGDNTLRFFTELQVDQNRVRAGSFATTLQFVVSYF